MDAFERAKRRTAERKAAGVNQTYPQHAHRTRSIPLPVLRSECPMQGALLAECSTCASPSEARRTYHCDHPANDDGRCTRGNAQSGLWTCTTCEHHPAAIWDSKAVTRIDPGRLTPTGERRKFNCSILDFQGRRLLAYRAGWSHAQLHIAELGPDLQPIGTSALALHHPQCEAGQEDPRLFIHGGELRLAFAGLQFVGGRLIVSQMLAALTRDLVPERVWEPKYSRRTLPMEKNWQFFERGDKLLCVYSVRPHLVLHVNDDGTATEAFQTPGPPADIWPGWVLRGGAPPVRVGDEYYSFFHGWRKTPKPGTPSGEWYDYAAGVYTFDAKPPFAIKRITRAPIWLPDARQDHLNVTRDKTVIYPSGAILDGSRWLVSAGHQDTECVIGEFPVDQSGLALEAIR